MDTLAEREEKILLALWRMKGVGQNRIREDTLEADLGTGASEGALADGILKLKSQGFVETVTMDGHRAISLTSLGLAILRQIEEDKLQELK
jgi:DNA-binding PadR family transcriptional regulator